MDPNQRRQNCHRYAEGAEGIYTEGAEDIYTEGAGKKT